MSNLIPFHFGTQEVRIHLDEDGEPWWVAKDVCDVLGLEQVNRAIARLKPEEKGDTRIITPGGMQTVRTINEPGLYRLIFRSDKSEAQVFQSWVFEEVLPSIRKTGKYEVAPPRPRMDGPPIPEEMAIRQVESWLYLGRMFGTPEHIIQQEAVKQIEATTGLNLRPLMLASPAQQNIAPEDMMLEPTELAVRFGLPSAYALNRHLEALGWQVKRIGGGWEPTPIGAPHATTHAWTAAHGTKSGYNLLWKYEAMRHLFITHGVLPQPQPQLPLLEEEAPHA
jgi:prophage antirepressor-like protein